MSKSAEQAACETEPAGTKLRPDQLLMPGVLVRQVKAERNGRRPVFLMLSARDAIRLPSKWSKLDLIDSDGRRTWRWGNELEVVR